MELFVDNSWEGFFLDLVSFYLKAQQSGTVKLVNLSPGALKLLGSGAFALPNVPCLITPDKGSLGNAPFIAQYLAEKAGAKSILFGEGMANTFNVRNLA